MTQLNGTVSWKSVLQEPLESEAFFIRVDNLSTKSKQLRSIVFIENENDHELFFIVTTKTFPCNLFIQKI